MLAPNPTSSRMTWLRPVGLVCLLWLIGCSSARPIFFDTGSDYVVLRKGQMFEAPRDMTLATESVIQRKDQQILDLIEVNKQLLRESQFLKGD